jgi:hypothetical protein
MSRSVESSGSVGPIVPDPDRVVTLRNANGYAFGLQVGRAMPSGIHSETRPVEQQLAVTVEALMDSGFRGMPGQEGELAALRLVLAENLAATLGYELRPIEDGGAQ